MNDDTSRTRPRTTRDAIFAAIIAERERQAARWDDEHEWGYGDCSSPGVPTPVKVMVLAEEFGEVARAVLDSAPVPELRDELIQVAAVAVAWLEGLGCLPDDREYSHEYDDGDSPVPPGWQEPPSRADLLDETAS